MTTENTTTTEDTEETPQDLLHRINQTAARIRRARGAMPYGAMVRSTFPERRFHQEPDPLTLEDVATYLEGLQRVLEGVSKGQQAEQAELRTLQATIAGGRELLLAMVPELAKPAVVVQPPDSYDPDPGEAYLDAMARATMGDPHG